jgi:spermidine synthase
MTTNWRAHNSRAIEERLQPVKAMPDGVVHHCPQSPNNIVVTKLEGTLYMEFHAEYQAEIQARMELGRPLCLLSPYAQSVMLGLLWNPRPARIYMAGLGGGRMPLVMHHHLPHTQIECTEIDKEVVNAAMRFFGVPRDNRLKLVVRDGRRYLAERGPRERYDIIMIDAFEGLGRGPRQFATREFFTLCRQHLSDGGVMIYNILGSDPSLDAKRATLLDSFEHVYAVPDLERGNLVLFAGATPLPDKDTILRQAAAIQEECQFEFPFVPHAARMEYIPRLLMPLHAGILHDEAEPQAQMPAKTGRNDDCPCGSGKKYKKCHG